VGFISGKGLGKMNSPAEVGGCPQPFLFFLGLVVGNSLRRLTNLPQKL